MKDMLYEIASGSRWDPTPLIRQARGSGDDELADFFREVEEERNRHKEEARRLLAGRLAE